MRINSLISAHADLPAPPPSAGCSAWDQLLMQLHDGLAAADRMPLRELARGLGQREQVTRATVQEMRRAALARLTAEGDVALTAEGYQVAAAVVRRQRVVECFLAGVLNVGIEEVSREALRLGSVISNAVERRMFELMGEPEQCPHGKPIPADSRLESSSHG